MRVHTLRMEKYGAFEGRSVELGTGLGLVLGSNEAGKSTMLDALADLLWSFPTHSRRDFLFSRQALVVRAVLHLPGGEPLEVERVARGLTAVATGAAHPATWQEEGDDWKRWRTSFGLSHEELRRGGRELCEARGDLADLVFQARSGQSVHQVLAELSERADGLYKANRNAKAVRTRVAMAEYERVSAQARHEMASAFDVVAVQAELERARNEVERTRSAVSRAASAHDELTAKLRILGNVRDLAGLRERVAEVESGGACLSEEDLAVWSRADAERAAADGLLEDLARDQEELAKCRALVVVDHQVLDDHEVISRLERQRSARLQDAENAAEDLLEADRVEAEARALLDDLVRASDTRPVDVLLDDLWVGEDQARELDVAAEALAGAEALVADREQDAESAAAQVPAAGIDAEAPEEQAVAAVREALAAVEKDGSPVSALRHAVGVENEATRERADRLVEAGLPVGTRVGAIPQAESVKAFRDRLANRVSDLRSARAALDSATKRITSCQGRLAEEDAREVPDSRAIETARAERDAVIDEVVHAWLSGTPASAAPDLPVRVERVVRGADRVADLVAEHHEAAIRRAHLAAELIRAEEDGTAALKAVTSAQSDLVEVEGAWRDLWSSTGAAAPAPDDALRFHKLLAAVLAAEGDAETARHTGNGLRPAADHQRAYLAEALRRAGRPRDDADLDSLVEAAGDLLDEDDRAREARAVSARMRTLADTARQRLAAAREAVDTARSAWREVATAAGLGDLGTDGWQRRRAVLTEARAAHRTANDLRAKAHRLDGRYRDFHVELLAIAARHGIDGDEPSVVEVLRARLDEAVRARVEAESLADRFDTVKRKSDAALRERALAAGELEALRKKVGADDLRLAATRGAALSDLRREVDKHTALIATALPGTDVTTLVADLADVDADVLRLDVEAAEALRARATEEHEAAVLKVGVLQQQHGELVGRVGAAELHAQAQERLAVLADDVEDYLVALVQQTVLREELEAYERRHASPLLDRAGRILEELTDRRYVALRTHNHASGRSLGIVGADEQVRKPDQLSEGTADQAFLALRLAGIESLQEERVARGLPTLPVVLDDVLMTFDDARAAAALKVLSRLAHRWQVVVLSHHDHLGQVAEGLGLDNLTVSTLSPPAHQEPLRSPDEIRDAVRESSLLDTRPTPHPIRGTRNADSTAIRTWAREKGLQVAERGRISADVVEAYEAEHR